MDDTNDVSTESAVRLELERTRHELAAANDRFDAARQQIDRTHRELLSAVGELDATSKQLQETNGELARLNDELQRTSEALQTANEELRRRTIDLDGTKAVLRSVFGSLRSAVVVLDRSSRVMAWNHRAADLWGLHAGGDSPGNFFRFDTRLPVAEVRAAIAEVLEGRVRQYTLLPRLSVDGLEQSCRLSVSPLQQDRNIGGVILLLEDAAGAQP
jgi:two-component system, chemotaxis family, CheB/CheR fusion protein